jgi:hypothetical protein
MHGEEIRPRDATSVVESASFLLYELSSYLDEYKYKPSESLEVSPSEIDEYKKAQYRLTTLVPLVDKALKNVYIVDQEELDEFLEGYNEYAEFVVELVSIKPNITKR